MTYRVSFGHVKLVRGCIHITFALRGGGGGSSSSLPDRDPGVLLGLVVAYLPRFFDSDGFFILDPWGFHSDRGFSKLMDDAFIWAEVFWN